MAGWSTSFTRFQGGEAAQFSRQYKIAASLAFAGAFNPLPFPLTGLHKFYLGQPIWGGFYLLLGWTHIPRVACAVEGFWYLFQLQRGDASNSTTTDAAAGIALSQQTQAIASALRELEKLRQEGLISEQEFEQNRRSLLDKLI
ncbi:hypothetical protein PN498_12800 [Oscillatoria sp. CS-180]|uniref:hypothetical protein n=1 Tax=Oscillatoria sp. CS-180 TaxID=3021720 RepID=UPI00232DA868|nr:hypothetical protein [Oscillatoria sp. CS-180]MDB9526871.1 hypothetical protein [Oscillatoria sp. CS-180]